MAEPTAPPSTHDGTLENERPPFRKSYKLTPLSITRHVFYWTFSFLVIFLLCIPHNRLDDDSYSRAFATATIVNVVLFIVVNIVYAIASKFYDIPRKCYDPDLLPQKELDNVAKELSQVFDRLEEAKTIFNDAATPEAAEEARTRMTELYVVKQTLSKICQKQSMIRPKLMFLIIYGSPYVRIFDSEANDTAIQGDTAPVVSSTTPLASQPSTTAIIKNEDAAASDATGSSRVRQDSDGSVNNVF